MLVGLLKLLMFMLRMIYLLAFRCLILVLKVRTVCVALSMLRFLSRLATCALLMVSVFRTRVWRSIDPLLGICVLLHRGLAWWVATGMGVVVRDTGPLRGVVATMCGGGCGYG